MENLRTNVKPHSRIFIVCLVLLLGFPVQAATKECKDLSENVARAMFTTQIDDREPIDRVLILENQVSQLYFFSDLRHLQGQTIKHRWEYEGRVIKEKTFKIQGPRWRIYSLNNLDKDMLGRWTVVIADENNCPLKAVIFQYVKSSGSNGSAIMDLR